VSPPENTVPGKPRDSSQCHQLDDGLQGNGDHQTFVFLAGRQVTGTKQHSEGHDHDAKHKCQPLMLQTGHQDVGRFGHCPHLHCQQGHHAGDHGKRGQRAGQLAAVAIGKQVGQ
jgi:hypothetical protein